MDVKIGLVRFDEKETALGVSVPVVTLSIEVGTASVRRSGGEGGRGANVGGAGHRPEGAGGPDEDLRGDSVPAQYIPVSVDCRISCFEDGDAETPESPKPNRRGVLPLGSNVSLVALGVDMTSQPGSSSEGPKNDSGRLGTG